MKRKLACALLSFAAGTMAAVACTTVIVGKSASVTGRVLVGHNEDDAGDLRVIRSLVPSREHRADATLPAEVGCARIPQVGKTLGFYWSEVKSAEGGLSNADGFLNEKGVLITSNNAWADAEDDAESGLTDGGLKYSLRRAVAERATSARNAVAVITNLVTVWGYAQPGRLYTVADGDEAWVVEIVRGRRFVARRCPDDAVVVLPNCYTIHGIEKGDIVSPGIAARAVRETGFDFAKSFQGIRRWKSDQDVYRFKHIYRLVAGMEYDKDDCPFSSPVRRKVDVEMLKRALSTHYEGTPDEVMPLHGNGDPKICGRAVCRGKRTVETMICAFGETVRKTTLDVDLDGCPCQGGFHTFKPFTDGVPDWKGNAAEAIARLETHLLPLPSKGGIDVDFLVGLLGIPSETHNQRENNRCIEYMRAHLEPRGVHCQVLTTETGRKCLYAATLPGKCHDYVFVSHVDVVPAESKKQYEPYFDGDWVYARGACDTKGNVATILQVLVNLAGRASVGAMIATDEETRPKEGGKPTPQLVLEAGYIPQKFILVGDSAGEEPNQLFVAEKGHVCLRLRAHGKGGHSSRPWALDNPLPKLFKGYLAAMERLPPVKDPDDHWRDVISPTVIQGGAAKNQIPETAELVLSLRYTELGGELKWADFLRRHSGLEVVVPPRFRVPVVSDPSAPVIQGLFKAMRAKWPDDGVRIGRMSAATDATYFAHLKLPTVIYAPTGVGPHSSDEGVSVRSLSEYAEMLTGYLKNESLKWEMR